MKYVFTLLVLFCFIPQFVFAGVNTHAAVFVSASSQYAKKASPTGIPSGGNARTITAWVQTSTGGETYFEGYGQDTASGQFDLTTDTNLLSIRQNGGNRRYNATNITNGSWHSIAIIYPGASVNINSATVDAYMDSVGAQLTDNSSASGITNTSLGCIQIGADSGGGCATPTVFFNGNVDDLQIWDKALSTAEITAAWDGCNLSDSATNLVFRARLDNNFNDSTANANNLSPSGSSPTFTSSPAYTCAVAASSGAGRITIVNTRANMQNIRGSKP